MTMEQTGSNSTMKCRKLLVGGGLSNPEIRWWLFTVFKVRMLLWSRMSEWCVHFWEG